MESIKRLFPYLKPYRGTIIITLFLGVLLGATNLGMAKIVQVVNDDIFIKKDQRMLMIVPIAAVLLYLVMGILRYFHMYMLRYTGDRISVDIRNDLQSQYANLSLDFHTENSSGGLISKTMNDVVLVQLGLTLLADVVREPLTIVALLGYLFYTNWMLASTIFLAAPVVIIASKSLGRSVRKYSHMMQETNEEWTSTIKETVDGIRVVKAFGLENHMIGKFKKVADKFLFTRRKILSREELAGPVFELMAAIVVSGILYFAGWQIIQGKMTPGEFLAIISVLAMLQGPIKKLQDAHVRIQHTIAAAQRVFSIVDTPIKVQDPEKQNRLSKTWPENWDTIDFKNVQFTYGNHPILRGINLTVRRGEVIAIVGASGAGKTTLVNLLPRFYDVQGGQVTIGGTDIRDFKVRDLRGHIGLVTQDVFLFNESIKANILASEGGKSQSGKELMVNNQRVQEALEAAHAASFVNRLPAKTDTIVGDRGAKLSGGERQRISIARAVFKNAPILILDEATSSLDSQSEQEVQRALDELMQGRTTFVIAHRLSTIQKAHRIIVLSEGKIIEEGNHTELLQRQGAYQKLHSIQFSNA
jgi:subfamily B ATP-binding cassette protein MsbA